MANQTPAPSRQNTFNVLLWLYIGLMVLTATTLGLILVVLRLIELGKQGRVPSIFTDPHAPAGARSDRRRDTLGRPSPADAMRAKEGSARRRVLISGTLSLVSLMGLYAVALGEGSLWFPANCLLTCGAYLLSGLAALKTCRRFRGHLAVIGESHVIPLSRLSGPHPLRDAEVMLALGLLPPGVVDRDRELLLLGE